MFHSGASSERSAPPATFHRLKPPAANRDIAYRAIFDPHWYFGRYPDVAAAGIEPLRHYLDHGFREGRDPHPLFSSTWYLKRYPDIAAACLDPLLHYVERGASEGRDPHPLFFTRWYLERYPDVAAARLNPLLHFIEYGGFQGRDPQPLFHSRRYIDRYPDVAASGAHPLMHYAQTGMREGRIPCDLFEPLWYLRKYRGVGERGLDPLRHYWLKGARAGYDPGPDFDTSWYVEQNPDVATLGLNPLQHYHLHGLAEGRPTHPPRPSKAFLTDGPSSGALAATRRLIDRFSPSESSIAALGLRPLFTLPLVAAIAPSLARAWGLLFGSLPELPSALVLVSSIGSRPLHSLVTNVVEAASLGTGAGSTLIVATDDEPGGVGQASFPQAEWRSLAALDPKLTAADRLALVVALINTLQPESLLVLNSDIGWQAVASHGHAITSFSRIHGLFSTVGGNPRRPGDQDPHSLFKRYFVSCLPLLSSVTVDDPLLYRSLADRFGMPLPELEKVHLFDFAASPGEWQEVLFPQAAPEPKADPTS